MKKIYLLLCCNLLCCSVDTSGIEKEEFGTGSSSSLLTSSESSTSNFDGNNEETGDMNNNDSTTSDVSTSSSTGNEIIDETGVSSDSSTTDDSIPLLCHYPDMWAEMPTKCPEDCYEFSDGHDIDCPSENLQCVYSLSFNEWFCVIENDIPYCFFEIDIIECPIFECQVINQMPLTMICPFAGNSWECFIGGSNWACGIP